MIDTVRALIAVNLDMAATRRMVAWQRNASAGAMDEQGARDELTRWAWTSPAALHICLRDLGWVDEPLARAVVNELRKIAAPLSTTAPGASMTLKLEPPCALPEPRRAKLLAVEVQDPEEGLTRFAQQVDECLASMGFPSRAHAFRPRVVVARRCDPVDLQPWFDALAAGANHSVVSVQGQAEATELAVYYVPVESFEPAETTTPSVVAAPLPALGKGEVNLSPSYVLSDVLAAVHETTPSALDEGWGEPQAAVAEVRPTTEDTSKPADATARAPHETPSWKIAHPWASKQGIELACLARMALISQARARQLAAEAPRSARGRQRTKSAANQRHAADRATHGRGRASSAPQTTALETTALEPSFRAEGLPSETASALPVDDNGWAGVTETSPDVEAFDLNALDEETPGPDSSGFVG